jgi:predicted RNA methylase
MTDSPLTIGVPRAKRRKPGPLTYSDLDPSNWREYDDVELGSLWMFPSRARGDGHANEYHGNYIPQIATQTLRRFTRKGDVVLDMFLGSGTTALEARRLGRRCVGVEIKKDMAAAVRAKFPEDDDVRVVHADSRSARATNGVLDALRAWDLEQAQFLMLHPPYHDIIRFSDMAGDLSNAETLDDFLSDFGKVARRGYKLLQPGRFAVLVIGDKYAAKELVPLGFQCMQEMTRAGFRVKSIVVKNMAGNEIGKGKDANLWRYRALRGGFYIFKHEYVIVFQKPEREAK